LPQYISLSVSPVCGEIAAGLHYALPASLKISWRHLRVIPDGAAYPAGV